MPVKTGDRELLRGHARVEDCASRCSLWVQRISRGGNADDEWQGADGPDTANAVERRHALVVVRNPDRRRRRRRSTPRIHEVRIDVEWVMHDAEPIFEDGNIRDEVRDLHYDLIAGIVQRFGAERPFERAVYEAACEHEQRCGDECCHNEMETRVAHELPPADV